MVLTHTSPVRKEKKARDNMGHGYKDGGLRQRT
jgi:hypothetical protein